MKPDELFYIKRDEVNVEGPYDLVKMGDFLCEKSITSETLVRVEGSLKWQPFSEYPQYEVVKETSIDAASRLNSLEKEAEAHAPLIPFVSREGLIKLATTAFLLIILGGTVYVIARCDETAGTIIMFSGLAIASVAQCLIFGQMLNEDFFTIGKVSFVPLYDIYYFASNLDFYFSKFFAKYLGWTVTVAAAAGMGKLHLHMH